MMSIGTLLAYSLVSACTLVLRYRPNSDEEAESIIQTPHTPISFIFGKSSEPLIKRFFWPAKKECNNASAHLVNVVASFDGKLNFVVEKNFFHIYQQSV